MSDELEPTAYPLHWPVGRPRCPSRSHAKFGKVNSQKHRESLTIADGAKRLEIELRRFGARDVVISTNVKVNLTGLPMGNAANPVDPGVAVYFRLHNFPHVLACDKWYRVADNLASIAKHVEAVRAQIRCGTIEENQVFTNVRLLAAVGVQQEWWQILGVTKGASIVEIDRAWELKIRDTHPDKAVARGVSEQRLSNEAAELNAARDEGRAIRRDEARFK